MTLDEASCTTLTNTFRVVGEWLETEKETSLGTMKARKCSICGEIHVGKVEYGSRYCPDCGNIMKNSADWDEIEVFKYVEETGTDQQCEQGWLTPCKQGWLKP